MMIMIWNSILDGVGNTPIIKLNIPELDNINLYVKLEFFNPTGSVKDRAAKYVIDKLLSTGVINSESSLIESSSGNFGIALAAYCKMLQLPFYCVIDPNISDVNQFLIESFNAKVIKVTERDQNGGFLLNRISKVKELLNEVPKSYWVNQYGSVHNAEAYYQSLGNEICREVISIDYVFLGVSSGGTITGVSQKIKEHYPSAKIIAVDIEGSVVFGGVPQTRNIPGIGSSMVPEILQHALIDEVITVDEVMTVHKCNELLNKHMIFAGGSSGSAIAAIQKYFINKNMKTKPNVVTIFPDRGDRYINTIYNKKWVDELIKGEMLYKV